MTITVYPVTSDFVAEAGDVDLSQPLKAEDLAAIKTAFWTYGCTMHRGTEFDDLRWVRDMHRATVSDIANTCEQAGVAVPA